MNEVQEVEWKECCVCDGKEKGDLCSTTKGILSLAGQFVEFWKNGLLPFNPAKITANNVVGEDWTEHPDFEHVMLRKSPKYHHNCHIQYSPYNLAWKKKSLRSKNKKFEVGQSSVFLYSSVGSNSRASSSSAIPNPICIICREHDAIENVHAAGAFHASKLKLNCEHVMKLTNNWRDIVVYIGDNALVNRLMIGDLGANSSFYHKRCSTNLYNQFTKKWKEECKGKIDTDYVKAAAWDKVIAFMNETLSSVAKKGFDLHELENICLDYLSEYKILKGRILIGTYNIRTIKRPRITNLDNRHYDKGKEISINIYGGLKLYSTVRSRTLIDCLFQLDICISYNRILSITKSIYEVLRTTFGHDKIFKKRSRKGHEKRATKKGLFHCVCKGQCRQKCHS